MNLLFLSAGRRCELISRFREALHVRGGGRIFASDVSPLAPALSFADEATLFPRGDAPEFAEFFVRFCREKRIHLVVPTIDPDLVTLDRMRDEFAKQAPDCRLLLSPSFTIVHARDKRRSRELFAKLGAKVPIEVAPGPVTKFPVFGKPPSGSASRGAGVLADAAALEAQLNLYPDLMVEEIVEGPETTVDVLCDFTGKGIKAIPRRRIRVRDGEVSQGIIELNPALEALSLRLAEGFRCQGPVTIQYRQPCPEVFVAMELNARVGGGLPLAIAAGADWCGWILDLCRGQRPLVDVPIINGMVMSRHDASVFLRPEEIATREATKK